MQTALRTDIDPDGLLEFSVVYTDRSLNHMSKQFQTIVRTLSSGLKEVYQADAVAFVSGGGTFAMEAVARQLAKDAPCLILRNGFFSYRWTQILEQGNISQDITVLNAKPCDDSTAPSYLPAPIDEVVRTIETTRPKVVFAPHTETASGITISEDYIKALADAVHAVDGLLVIDCIASGCVWLDMKALGIDVLISAPQKGWSASPCAGIVALGQRGLDAVNNSTSDSFAMDLKTWLGIVKAYENGGHAYHATMPTDGLKTLYEAFLQCQAIGFNVLKSAQIELGKKVRQLLSKYGYKSVAHDSVAAAGVVVCYTERDDIHKGTAFINQGVQIAGGVPLKVGEPDSFKTFRLGLFGLDKLSDIDGTVARLKATLNAITNG